MAIQSDPTQAGFNCYVSAAEAEAYFADVYFGDSSTWDDQADNQEALLITATRRLNALQWNGVAYADDQLLAFPRWFISTSEYGNSAPSTTMPPIPQWLKDATCEMALWIWTEADRPATDVEFSQLKSTKIGPLNYEFRDNTPYANLPPSVVAILRAQGAGVIYLGGGRSYGIVL